MDPAQRNPNCHPHHCSHPHPQHYDDNEDDDDEEDMTTTMMMMMKKGEFLFLMMGTGCAHSQTGKTKGKVRRIYFEVKYKIIRR